MANYYAWCPDWNPRITVGTRFTNPCPVTNRINNITREWLSTIATRATHDRALVDELKRDWYCPIHPDTTIEIFRTQATILDRRTNRIHATMEYQNGRWLPRITTLHRAWPKPSET